MMAEHGTLARYSNGGCRCDMCKAAGADYRDANRERLREEGRQWYHANRERVRERHAKWYEANRERALAAGRNYRDANPEYARRYSRDYRETLAVLNAAAGRSGLPYEAWEDAEVMRNDLRLIDIAAKTSRTVGSVRARREYLRRRDGGAA